MSDEWVDFFALRDRAEAAEARVRELEVEVAVLREAARRRAEQTEWRVALTKRADAAKRALAAARDALRDGRHTPWQRINEASEIIDRALLAADEAAEAGEGG